MRFKKPFSLSISAYTIYSIWTAHIKINKDTALCNTIIIKPAKNLRLCQEYYINILKQDSGLILQFHIQHLIPALFQSKDNKLKIAYTAQTYVYFVCSKDV